MSRFGWIILGMAIGLFLIGPLAVYAFVRLGGMPVGTSANPLPFEEMLAHTALRAAGSRHAGQKDPLPHDEANMLAGAHRYKQSCAVCHGIPGQPKTAIAAGMFPRPPQLFQQGEMVTDDPEGLTFWKISHGIRLSGMPGFEKSFPENERWQVTMLVANADKQSPAVQAELTR